MTSVERFLEDADFRSNFPEDLIPERTDWEDLRDWLSTAEYAAFDLLDENKALKKENEQLKQQIEKMKHRTERKFNPRKVLTCVTADKAKVGTRGCFADNLATLREEFAQKNIYTLTRTFSEEVCARFEADNYLGWLLFYPIDEELSE
jgi:regulator of replication initiation timing